MADNPSRRSALAKLGLGVAASSTLVGLPALAGIPSDDPVFAALADLERLRGHKEIVREAYRVAEEAVSAARRTIGPIKWHHAEFETVEKLDEAFVSRAQIHEAVDNAMKPFLENRPPRSPEIEADLAQYEADLAAEFLDARAQLERKQLSVAKARAQSGFDEAKDKFDKVADAEIEAEERVFKCQPRTVGGALALLAFVADHGEEFSLDEYAPAAIRNAIAAIGGPATLA